MSRPPNLPLRAGPSGPPVDWQFWLRNLAYFAGFRRLWAAQQSPTPITVPDAGSGTPGTEVLYEDVEWTDAEADIAGLLHYVVFARCVFNVAPAPAALPGPLLLNLNMAAAGGSVNTMHTWYCFTSPSGTGVFDTRGQASGAWLFKYGDFVPFAVGYNRIALGVGNPAAGADIYAQNAELLIGEIACPGGNLTTP